MAMFFSCSDLTASEAMYVFDAFLQRQNVFVASHNYDRFIFELLCELHGSIAMPEALRDFERSYFSSSMISYPSCLISPY
jgi:hypothetical protein